MIGRVTEAAAALERSLGEPDFTASVEADERDAFPEAAVAALHAAGYFEHFVPLRDGGRLANLGELLALGRVVARRDLTAAIATGQTLLGALPVWLDGTPAQRARIADLVRRGEPGCLALTEEARGSDIAQTDVTFTKTGAGDGDVSLRGEKWCINNATRGAFMTVLARGDRGLSVVLVDKSEASPAPLPRLRTHGIRGADISGARFDDTRGALVGREGGGLSLVFRTLALSRTACAAFSLGAGETALRLAYAFATERLLYGRTAYEIPIVRRALANAVADLLAAEALALVACRAASLVPEEMSVVSAVVKALVPALVDDVVREAGVVLGARGYLREGPYAVFQKLVRDHAVVGLFDGSTAVNLGLLANQLPRLAARRREGAAADARALFDLDGPLPDLTLAASRLRTTARGSDTLVSAIPALAHASSGRPEEARALALAAELEAFERSVLAHAAEPSPLADATSFGFARRYCLLAAGAACMGVLSSSPPLAGPRHELCLAALDRVLHRLDPSRDEPSEDVDQVFLRNSTS